MYAQGLATIALCEGYGLSGDKALKEPAQKAIDFIVKAQDPDKGGAYTPRQDSDTSVTGWQVMALKSGRYGWPRRCPITRSRPPKSGLILYRPRMAAATVM